jgi:Ca2+-binding RTX toxin-like protein
VALENPAPGGSEYVIVWHSYTQDGDVQGVYARQYDGDGNPAGPAFVSESAANGTVVNTASVIDVDAGDSFTFALTDDAGGRFGIDGITGVVAVADTTLLDYETAISHTLTVRVTDSGGLTYDETFTINVTDVIEGTSVSDTLNGTVGDDVILGFAGSDTLNGLAGNDWLAGGAGADSLFGLAGDDTLVWDSSDATIDGGTGNDTLWVESGDADLTTFAGTVVGIEEIDLEADAGANTLTLAAQDVLDISDTDVLTVLGDGGDSVDAGTGWTDGGIASGFHVYTQGLATLNLDTDLTVNPDILM